MKVGAVLRRLRTDLGATQQTVADLAGISQARLCQIESDNHSPTLRTVYRLATALKSPVLMFIGAYTVVPSKPKAETAPHQERPALPSNAEPMCGAK